MSIEAPAIREVYAGHVDIGSGFLFGGIIFTVYEQPDNRHKLFAPVDQTSPNHTDNLRTQKELDKE